MESSKGQGIGCRDHCFDLCRRILLALEEPVLLLNGQGLVEFLTPSAVQVLRNHGISPPVQTGDSLLPLPPFLSGRLSDFLQVKKSGGILPLFDTLEILVLPLPEAGEADRILLRLQGVNGGGIDEGNIREMVRGVSVATGEVFFSSMVQHLVRALQADHAFIGEFTDPARTKARTVAFCVDGQLVENCEFVISGTPCERVVLEGLQSFPGNVQEEFPNEMRARKLGVVAYYGIPLKSSGGEVIGLMSVMARRPLPDSQVVLTMLQVFAARAASELEHQYSIEARQEQLYFLQSLLDAIPNPLFYKDLEGRYLGCNAALRKALGLEKEHIVGRKVFEIAPEHRATICHREDLAVYRGEGVRVYGTEMTFADGTRHDVIFNKAPFFRRTGEMGGLVGVVHDVSELKETERRLRETQERYQTLFDDSPDAILIIDAISFLPFQFNDSMADLLGFSPEELGTHKISEMACDPLEMESRLADMAQKGQGEFEIRFRARKGTILDILIKGKRIELSEKSYLHLILRDLTQKKEAEKALRRSREFAETVLKTMNDAVLVLDTDTFRILGANQIFLDDYEIGEEDVLGRHCYEITGCASYPGSMETHRCPLQMTIDTGDFALAEHELINSRGEAKYVEVSTSPIRDEKGRIVQAVYVSRNITERKKAEKKIQQLAYYDPLTDLPNRTLLMDRLRQSLFRARRDGQKIGILFLDLDRFKGINDSLGHGTGDSFLRIVAQRLKDLTRCSDTVARIGGDEFVVLLNGIEQEDSVARKAGTILEVLSQPVDLDGTELFSSASIGIALYPSDGEDPETLLKNADLAMYQAKEKGRNGYKFFSGEMNRRAVDRMSMETRLRRALEREELFLHYQPQVDLKSGRIIGVEALLRWKQPELGLVSPGQFIPLAEETGLIIPIGEWVLREACRQNRKWQEAGLIPFIMAVNISGCQFRQPGLAEMVAELLQETGLDPRYLELELTETILMDNAESARKTLQHLKSMGVSLSIDDFGTGYSSLNYLKHFPLNRLKIDQSFVRDVTTNPEDARIAEAIIALAHSLRLKVLAEGVETADQMEFLRSRNCWEMQGYFFSRPIPGGEIPQLFGGPPLGRKR